MTPRHPSRRSSTTRRAAASLGRAVALLALLVVLGGCSGAQARSVVPPTPPTPPLRHATTAPTGAATTAATRTPPVDPQVVAWGRDGRLLSIVVRNADARQVLDGRVEISLHDEAGRLLLATSGPDPSKCCTLLSVPPGHRFGLFLVLPDDLTDIAAVSVAFAAPDEVALRPWPARASPPISISDPTLSRTRTDAVVTVTLRPQADVPPYVAGQAFLLDRHDHLVGVISGRFYCFERGQSRRVAMGLQHPVPDGTHLGDVVAYPIPPRVRPHVAYSCPSETS